MKIRDFRDSGYGIDKDSLPKSQKDAELLNSKYFYTTPCVNGHDSPRYTKGGRCVFCSMSDTAKNRGIEFTGFSKRAIANFTRKIAIDSGNRTYESSRPCKHGHYTRFTGSNNCVECSRISQEKRKVRSRNRRIEKIYGINEEEYSEILLSQNNKCRICFSEYNKKSFHIDHCHSSGAIRGILCSKCNQAIGLFKEDTEAMLRAIEYIKCYS